MNPVCWWCLTQCDEMGSKLREKHNILCFCRKTTVLSVFTKNSSYSNSCFVSHTRKEVSFFPVLQPPHCFSVRGIQTEMLFQGFASLQPKELTLNCSLFELLEKWAHRIQTSSTDMQHAAATFPKKSSDPLLNPEVEHKCLIFPQRCKSAEEVHFSYISKPQFLLN